MWLLAPLCAPACGGHSQALVVYVPTTPPSWATAAPIRIFIPGNGTSSVPTHATGIPDEVFRRVVLGSGGGRCSSFAIEQVIGGSDTGSVLWSGSVVLAELIGARAATFGIVPGSTAIELGAGLGLVSIVASCLGARVVATDGDESIQPVAKRNVLLNQRLQDVAGSQSGSESNEGGQSGAGSVDVRQLWWGDVAAARALGSFDTVLGSDLVYGTDGIVGPVAREASFAALLCTMWLLSHENTTLVLTYRERKPIEARFFTMLWEQFEPDVEGTSGEAWRGEASPIAGVPESSSVRLFTFRRRRRGRTGGDTPPAPYCAALGRDAVE
mmetsp:Transcript_24427/g.79892  ORF Transcript_24427/g.79892 Transcript_24427/m.79892 type:complete len:327 (+) Transcript_24427:75-1055(+)